MRKLLVLLAVVLVLGIGADSGYGWYQGQVDSAAGSSATPVPFTVTSGETSDQIAADLVTKGLIKNQTVFLLYVRVTGASAKFEAGQYVLRENMSMARIVQVLEHAVATQIVIQLPEGITLNRIAQTVQQKGIGSASEFVAATKAGSWQQFDFLSGRAPTADLQGYLFPDTYYLDGNATVKDVVRAQLAQFGKVFTAQWRAELAKPTAARPAESIENVVILSSLVQAEATDRMADVCSVYYNRLAANMPLQVDATILFAEGRGGAITDADKKFDSPYNTYLHAGLPPGAIGNPGAAALAACVNPSKSGFYYYFTDRQGSTHFEATLDQFNADVQRYGVKGS